MGKSYSALFTGDSDKESVERIRGEGEQTRVINFHIVWIMENVSLSSKNYTDLSPACCQAAHNTLWIVPALEYRANEFYDTPYLLAGNTSKDWKTRREIYFS